MTSALIAGLGNIGSPLAGLAARLGLRRLVLVDRDRIEEKNVRAQDYRPCDVGRFKANVLAERLRVQFPEIEIEAWTRDLEDLPTGVARVDLILGALDSRRARQVLATELAGPLGVPVIDGAVGETLRGRVQVFVPGSACLECAWGREDYRQLSLEYPCLPGANAEAPPTAAPAFLGTAVASVMTAEALRFLDGTPPEQSQEIAFDLLHRGHLVSRLRRNPKCRGCHAIIRECVELSPFEEMTAGRLLGQVRDRLGDVPMHLECRRGLGPTEALGSGRLIDAEWLRSAGTTPLRGLGLDRRDLVLVRSHETAFFVRFD